MKSYLLISNQIYVQDLTAIKKKKEKNKTIQDKEKGATIKDKSRTESMILKVYTSQLYLYGQNVYVY